MLLFLCGGNTLNKYNLPKPLFKVIPFLLPCILNASQITKICIILFIITQDSLYVCFPRSSLQIFYI